MKSSPKPVPHGVSLPSGPMPSVDRTIERLRELLRSLDIDDNEHPDVPLKHETKWCLSAYSGGLLVWQNTEADEGNTRHMKCVPRGKVLGLWLALAQPAIELEPWLPGYS